MYNTNRFFTALFRKILLFFSKSVSRAAGIFRASLTFTVGTIEKIRSAAIRQQNGTITEGSNHKEIRELILASTYEPIKGTEGFVTTYGRFVDRKAAV